MKYNRLLVEKRERIRSVQKLTRGAGKIVDSKDAAALLEKVIKSGDRVCLRGTTRNRRISLRGSCAS